MGKEGLYAKIANMAYDFITIGGATKDLSLFTAEGVLINNPSDPLRQQLIAFEQGAKIGVSQVWESFGGGAANTAVNLAKLGFKVATICDLGRDAVGKDIIANLKKSGVGTGLTKSWPQQASGMSLILIAPNGERVIFTARGANRHLDFDDARRRALNQAKNVYLSSLSGAWKQDLRDIFKNTSGQIFWNPGSSQLKAGVKFLKPFLKKTTVLIVNRDEAVEIVVSDPRYASKDAKTLSDVSFLLKTLHSYGPKVVLLTDGRAGSYCADTHRTHHQPIVSRQKAVDNTGVGDIYGSTWVAAWLLYQGDLKQASLLASRQAAAKVAHHGAQNGLKSLKELSK